MEVLWLVAVIVFCVFVYWMSRLPKIVDELQGLRRDLRRMRFRKVKLTRPIRLSPRHPEP